MSAMNEHQLETYKSLIAIATEAFKFSALINGGAAVAILAAIELWMMSQFPPRLTMGR